MTALGRVLVGYRSDDRRRLRLLEEYGQAAVPVRRCAAGCGYDVYVNPSGLAAMHERDPEVLCEPCADLYRVEIERREL